MSKNITIQEGGVAKQMTVDKLKTNLVGGGSLLWVPEDDTLLGTKYISENGTYRASADGLYGYSEVTVSGVGEVSGKDPDGSGDDATATVDPETGDIVITKQPSSIEVITPPTNPYGTYMDGQTITKDGMVVKAYLASGELYTDLPDGIVPNEQITLVPSVANCEGGTYQSTAYTSDLETAYNMPIPSGGATVTWVKPSTGETIEQNYEIQSGYTRGFVQADIGDTRVSVLAAKAGTGWYPAGDNRGIDTTGTTYFQPRPEYVIRSIIGAVATYTGTPTGNDEKAALWTLIYGEKVQDAGYAQTITVEWPRPDGKKVLETTFEILVAPGYTPGGGE